MDKRVGVSSCPAFSLSITPVDAQLERGGIIFIRPPMTIPFSFCGGAIWMIGDFSVSSPPGVKVKAEKVPAVDYQVGKKDIFKLTITKGRVREGQTIQLKVKRSRRNRSPCVSSEEAPFGVYYAQGAGEDPVAVAPFPTIKLVPKPAHKLDVYVGSRPNTGARKVKISAFDIYGNPTAIPPGDISLRIPDGGFSKVV